MNKNGQFRVRIRRRRASSRRGRPRRRARQKPIILGAGRIILGKRQDRKRKSFISRLGTEIKRSLGFGVAIPVQGLVVPAGGIGGGILKGAQAVGKFLASAVIPKSFTAGQLAKPAAALTAAGFLGTSGGRKKIKGAASFFVQTGQSFGDIGIIETLRRRLFGQPTNGNGALDLIGRQQQAAKEKGNGFISKLPSPTVPFVLGAGIGAGLLGLAGAIRSRGANLVPLLGKEPTLGAVEEPPIIGAPALEMTVPNINVRVKPQINVKTIVKPKIINIQQSMM